MHYVIKPEKELRSFEKRPQLYVPGETEDVYVAFLLPRDTHQSLPLTKPTRTHRGKPRGRHQDGQERARIVFTHLSKNSVHQRAYRWEEREAWDEIQRYMQLGRAVMAAELMDRDSDEADEYITEAVQCAPDGGDRFYAQQPEPSIK